MLNFIKSVFVGIGGVAPGLSGSVLLVIFGLYQQVVDAIGTLFKDFRKNVAFLLPMAAGVVVGVLLFSKVVDFLLTNYEFQTRYAFLGLIVGTIPLFWREVRKEGFGAGYVAVIAVALAAGVALVYFGISGATVQDPTPVQSVAMGIAYAGSAIIPGVDSAAIMSALGLYVTWVEALSNLDFAVLIPAACGLVVGLLLFSLIMHVLMKRLYTGTFSAIFGLFLSIVPSVLRDEAGAFILPSSPAEAATALALVVVGFAVAYYMGDIQGNNERIRRLLGRGEDAEA